VIGKASKLDNPGKLPVGGNESGQTRTSVELLGVLVSNEQHNRALCNVKSQGKGRVEFTAEPRESSAQQRAPADGAEQLRRSWRMMVDKSTMMGFPPNPNWGTGLGAAPLDRLSPFTRRIARNDDLIAPSVILKQWIRRRALKQKLIDDYNFHQVHSTFGVEEISHWGAHPIHRVRTGPNELDLISAGLSPLEERLKAVIAREKKMPEFHSRQGNGKTRRIGVPKGDRTAGRISGFFQNTGTEYFKPVPHKAVAGVIPNHPKTQ